MGIGSTFLDIYYDSAVIFNLTDNMVIDGGNLTVTAGNDVCIAGGNCLSEGMGSGASRIHVSRSSNQLIPNADNTVILFNVEEFDNLGEYNPADGKFTATNAGYYQVNAQLLLTSTAGWGAGEIATISMYKNDVFYSNGDYSAAMAAITWYGESGVSDIVYLAATDYITIKFYQNNGAAINTYPSSAYTYFSVHRLS